MELLKQLSEIYFPLQPSVRNYQDSIVYEESSPPNDLSHIIYCFWELKSNNILDDYFHYKVVSDGCIDIFFDLKNPSKIFVMGFCHQYKSFSIGTEFDYVGIRFFPSVFPQLFGIDASQLSDSYFLLKYIVPDFYELLLDEMSLQYSPPTSFEPFVKVLRTFINSKEIKFDSSFFEALFTIISSDGVVDVETEIKTGLSPGHLRRIFKQYIGTTPKSFAKVIRFHKVLKAKMKGNMSKLSKVYFDLGFYDQAHFIKDFKRHYGVTPSEALYD